MMIKRPGYDGPSNFMRKAQGTGMADGFMKKGPGYIRGVTMMPQPLGQSPPRNTIERK